MEAAPLIPCSLEITHMVSFGSLSSMSPAAKNGSIPISTSSMEDIFGGMIRFVFSIACSIRVSGVSPAASISTLFTMVLAIPFSSCDTGRIFISQGKRSGGIVTEAALFVRLLSGRNPNQS